MTHPIDEALLSIERQRKKLREEFRRNMNKLEDDERDLIGLKAIERKPVAE